MNPNDLLLTTVRAMFVDLFVLYVVSLMGKRSMGTISAFDLIVAVIARRGRQKGEPQPGREDGTEQSDFSFFCGDFWDKFRKAALRCVQ